MEETINTLKGLIEKIDAEADFTPRKDNLDLGYIDGLNFAKDMIQLEIDDIEEENETKLRNKFRD